jgi:hypothetical protein
MAVRQKSRKLINKDFKEVNCLLDSTIETIKAPQPVNLMAATDNLNRLKEILSTAEPLKDPDNSHLPSSKALIKPAKQRQRGKRSIGGQEGHQGHTHQLEEKPDEIVDLTQAEYKNSPDWIKIGVQRCQVVGLVSEKKVIEFTITLYENFLTKEKSPIIFPEGVNAPVQFSSVQPRTQDHGRIFERFSVHLL